MEELLKSIGISATGESTKDGAYVVDIKDFDEYGVYFSKLDKSDLEEVSDTSQITTHTTNVTFANDEYQITLLADLVADSYKLVITEF